MLSNKVSEIMTTHLITAAVTASVFEVMEKMVAEDVGRIIVTDDDVPVGIFTEKDVLNRVVKSGFQARKTAIKKVMTAPIRAVPGFRESIGRTSSPRPRCSRAPRPSEGAQ